MEQLPAFEAFPFQRPPMCERFFNKVSTAFPGVKISTETTENGLMLTIRKVLPENAVRDAIEERVLELRQTMKPKYKLVQDMFGNQYYVEQNINENEYIMNNIDIKTLGRKLAKNSFKGYSLELNHDASYLNIFSHSDNLNKNLNFASIIEDFYVQNCNIEDNTAFLKVGVILKDQPKVQQQHSETKKISQKRVEKKRNEDDRSKRQQQLIERRTSESDRILAESKRLGEEVERKERAEIAAKKEQQRKDHAMRIEAERLAQENDMREKAAKEEIKRKEEIRIAQEQEEARILREKILREQIEYEKQLAEEDRQIKLQREQAQRVLYQDIDKEIKNMKPIRKIDINFKDATNEEAIESDYSDNELHESDISSETKLRRVSSPVLENVNDEELERFQASLSQSPKGNSIIEDI